MSTSQRCNIIDFSCNLEPKGFCHLNTPCHVSTMIIQSSMLVSGNYCMNLLHGN